MRSRPSLLPMVHKPQQGAPEAHRGSFAKLFGLEIFIIQSNSGGNKMIINQVGSRAQGTVPIYWHKGHYTSHTGGWPCDTVTLAEYDDLGLRGIPGGFAP